MYSDSDEEFDRPVRKRMRLDHLTADEKLARRKMKNRVAAQTARDRKKARIDRLEDSLEACRQELVHVKTQNELLYELNAVLQKEVKELKERKCQKTPVGPAAIISAPRLREQGVLFLAAMLIILKSLRKCRKQPETLKTCLSSSIVISPANLLRYVEPRIEEVRKMTPDDHMYACKPDRKPVIQIHLPEGCNTLDLSVPILWERIASALETEVFTLPEPDFATSNTLDFDGDAFPWGEELRI
ncbi:unnamed protein product [Notodromas monacha]|uniref:X-box-binding protein 1 n=1 Tax=Notodromas monacha TaxID=399045 RepID=A0A7R9BGB3_9CRUS|nr:unnamed protein product [Notodromas monacha]CAG0913343.1 unnamed protein product [Notodromas monacha]